jgi:predicted transposase/invertase (TIGR01784 family)
VKLGIDPAIDCVFKKLFGSDNNKELLLDLVNGVLEQSGEPKIAQIEILNPYNPKTFLQDKLSIVDVKAKSETGEWFILEVQMHMYGYFPKRILYYWAWKYQDGLKEGEQYHLLKKVSLICITKEPLPIATVRFFNHFQVLEVQEGVVWCDDFHLYTIELAKFLTAAEDLTTRLERWTYFLKHGEHLDDEALPKTLNSPLIQQAVKETCMFNQNDTERDLYESRRRAMMDQSSIMAEVEERGFKKGKEEGRQEGEKLGIKKGKEEGRQEVVWRCIQQGLDNETIHNLTGMALGEIEQMRNTSKS